MGSGGGGGRPAPPADVTHPARSPAATRKTHRTRGRSNDPHYPYNAKHPARDTLFCHLAAARTRSEYNEVLGVPQTADDETIATTLLVAAICLLVYFLALW